VDCIQNRYVLNCRLLSDELMARHIETINRKPGHRYMVAYVSELYDLACFCLENNLTVKKPFKGICTTTGELTEEMRETIASVFHGPVYSRYGSREIGDIAVECEFTNGLHVNPLLSYIEVVDDHGEPVPAGEEGRILVTGLRNDLMPLIRYEIQDMGILKEPYPCRCGRHWTTFARITGRVSEHLLLPDGSRFGKVFLQYAMESYTALWGYQLHQMSPTHVEVQLVSPVQNYVETHTQEIQLSDSRLRQCTGNQICFTYRQVDALEKAASGKRLVILNKIALSAPDTFGERDVRQLLPV
jgi:phenylacetate-CoA ligase